MLSASTKTPVERTADLLEQGLNCHAIAARMKISEPHCRQLVRLARREIGERKVRRSEYYQRYHLPQQLAAARAKVAMLESKAVDLGMPELVGGEVA